MNKKAGIIGKIMFIILIIFLVLIAIAGFTAWQAYSLIKTVTTTQMSMQSDFAALVNGDCSKLPIVEAGTNQIISQAKGACMNPIIRIAVDKMDQMPMKCSSISTLESQMQLSISQFKVTCQNKTSSGNLSK